MDPAAQRHLADRLEMARRVLELGPGFDSGESRRSLLASYGGAPEAFRAIGAVSVEETQDWNNRMLSALGIDLPEPPPDTPGMATVQAVLVGAPGEEAPPDLELPRAAGSMVRAIVAPATSWEYASGRFQVLSVVVFEHQVSVLWREHPLVDPAIARPEDLRVAERDLEGLPPEDQLALQRRIRERMSRGMPIEALEDDLGTEYQSVRGGSSGTQDDNRGHQDFAPEPPAEAARLYITWNGRRIEVPLTQAG